jgi:hypothetical protein
VAQRRATRDLTSFLTATGVSMGAANGRLALNDVPTILQSFNVSVNFYTPFQVAETMDTLLLDQSASVSGQLLPMVGMAQQPTLSVTAHYIAAPSLVPVPPT